MAPPQFTQAGLQMKKQGNKGHGASRQLKTRIKRKSGLKPSSRRWLERHMNDPYVHRAKAEGYRARSAFKLTEINDRYGILKPGMGVVDLGAAPGGWSQVAARITGSTDEHPLIVAIDYLPVDPISGVIILQKDFLDDDAPDALIAALGKSPGLVMSDMAAPTIGHRQTDHIRTMHLCEVAADFAISVLEPGGAFLAKTFQGGTEGALLTELKRNFTTVRHVKPDASREESVELYLLATGFKGREEPGE